LPDIARCRELRLIPITALIYQQLRRTARAYRVELQDIDDIVQDALERELRTLPEHQAIAVHGLRRQVAHAIAARIAYERARKRAAVMLSLDQMRGALAGTTEFEPLAADNPETAVYAAEVLAQVKQLNPIRSRALLLLLWTDAADAARHADCSPNTFYARLYQARLHLSKATGEVIDRAGWSPERRAAQAARVRLANPVRARADRRVPGTTVLAHSMAALG
jgi:DNA-directed RNA polymerase specialized sigma24 family protein